MQQGPEEHALEEYSCLNTSPKPVQFPSLWNLPINHFQPTVVKQVFRSENFGLMLGLKTFQTK